MLRALKLHKRLFGGVIPSKFLLVAVAALGIGGAVPATAEAGGYTVYIYNTRTNYGWVRTGFTHDLYTSQQACRNSIVRRVNENKRYRTDFEAFAVVYQNSRPPAGLLQSFVSAYSYIMYIPGRGYIASINTRASGDDTAVCQGGPGGAPGGSEQVRAAPLLFRREQVSVGV
jgi:hypothetical protein